MTETTPGTMLSDRAVLRLSGPDVREFLQGLVTNDVTLLAPGRPLWAALLSPQGKALFDFMLWQDGDDVLIDAEAAQAEKLARTLGLYRLRRAITIAPDGTLAVHWSASEVEGSPDPRLAALGWRWLAPAGPAAGNWRAHRLALGVCEGIAELGSGETLWLECNARELGGVSFAKGCYIGQENTARMHHRAKVNRRLVVTPLTEAGAEGGDRIRATYPELGLAVEHRRVDALGDALISTWLADALAANQRPTAV